MNDFEKTKPVKIEQTRIGTDNPAPMMDGMLESLGLRRPAGGSA